MEGWEVIDGLEGRIGKKVLKIDVLRMESFNWIWVVTVRRQGTYYVWKWSVAARLGRWAMRNLHKFLWLAGTEYQNWWTLHVIHKAAFPRVVYLTNTCHLLIIVKSWERCAFPFPTWLSVCVILTPQKPSLHFTFLHFTSIHVISLPSLHISSLHITSLHITSHHFPSLRF